jgi:class 3 adenylate cyclase/predicted Ser/Thr protein kinase
MNHLDDIPPVSGRASDIPETLAADASTVREIAGLALPERIGRYRILKRLGKGGMGAVYLAEDTQLRRKVALKVPNFGPDERPDVLERFYREARTAARLQHPHICPVFDVDQIDGRHVLTMAYLEGDTLAKLVPEFPNRPPTEAAALVRTVALALDEAHRQGIIHRDLKPANIMIDPRGRPVVMDFGLAREIEAASSELSSPGMVMGTPDYMAPEQARGDLTMMGPGCDVYSLGVVLFQLLTGTVPFQGTTMDVLAQHLRAEPPSLASRRPDTDPRLEAICRKAMAKEPSQRFLCMGEFAQALEEYERAPSAAAPAAEVERPLDRAVADALVLLRTWGWEAGVARLRERLERPGDAQPEELALLLEWLAGQPDAHERALECFKGQRQLPTLAGWALAGQAFLANSQHHFGRALQLLRQASAADPRDNILQAELSIQRAFRLYQTGELDEAIAALHVALDLCGRQHFLTGVALDVLGLVYANKNNFLAAAECFEQSLECKQRFREEVAVARSYRHLGQFCLEWGDLDRAERSFQKALQLALKSEDERGQASAFHYLGKLELYRGEREASAGRLGAAHRHQLRSAEWFDAGVSANEAAGRGPMEAHARRDRALLHLAGDRLAEAGADLDRAEALFRQGGHEEGVARVLEVRGILARRQGRFAESKRMLRAALNHFDGIADFLEAARAQLEIARTLAAAKDPRQLVVHEYLDALVRAERCRRTGMIRTIEEELRAVDEEALSRHLFRRSRGRSGDLDTASLDEGVTEVASVLFLNLRGFIPFCQGLDPGEVMRTVNQMMTDVSEVLEGHGGFVTSYLGGGFMALLRGAGHAERAVRAALDMIAVVAALNRPRAVLGLRQLPVRIGVASGSVFLGNIGTYQKMDFTAVGPAVNLAARLMRCADPTGVCVSQATYELVRQRFEFAAENPRSLDLPEIGSCPAWDAVGLKASAPA